jgi:hypothetical protein
LREEHRLKVFENGVLREMFGAKRDEVTGEWRKLHNEELYGLYSALNFIWVIKLRRIRWVGYVARMEKGEVQKELWRGDLSERNNLEDLDVDGRIMLKLIFKKWDE